MRTKANGTAERLWQVVQEAIDRGVTLREFVAEVGECYSEVHSDRAVEANKEIKRMLER